ncbi:MAG: BMC domain-containing protein [Christensenellales bacterium]|jgi:ethanolamine utilization protein EutM
MDQEKSTNNQSTQATQPQEQQAPKKAPAKSKTTQIGKGANMMKAIGMIETRGLTAAIEAIDTMLKAAEVELVGIEKIGSGLVTAIVQGDVGAVKAATEAGAEAAGRLGEIVAIHVIPRGHVDIKKVLPSLS